ncbi:MAG: thiol-disulfide isomerase [Lactococcus lactis]|nr:thiol-disulfide isomerase [Lactococcus lactis]
MITLNVNSLENAEIFWKELGLEDEVALNETYDPNPETLAISVETIDEIHDKIIELGLPVSPITPAVDGRFMFSFIAPEDNTFIVIGEWVERPYTGEMRTEFFENVKELIPLAPERLSELTEGQFVLFGRVTCPWTRRFVKALPDYADKMI